MTPFHSVPLVTGQISAQKATASPSLVFLADTPVELGSCLVPAIHMVLCVSLLIKIHVNTSMMIAMRVGSDLMLGNEKTIHV